MEKKKKSLKIGGNLSGLKISKQTNLERSYSFLGVLNFPNWDFMLDFITMNHFKKDEGFFLQ